MKKITRNIFLISICSVSLMTAQLVPDLGGQRVGITSLQFMKIGVGARGCALGESMAAMANDISALYWNPAGLVLNEENALMVSHTEWLVDLKHDFAGISYHLTESDVLGFSFISLASDDILRTTEFQPNGDGSYFKYSDIALGLTYSRKMTSQFSFGVTVRYVQETLDILKIKTMLFDLGTYYTMGDQGVRIGVVIANFGSEVSPQGNVTLLSEEIVQSFQSFSPPTTFKVGIAFEPYETAEHRLTTSIQLNHPNDNAENLRFGVEYCWNSWMMLRSGLKRTIGEPFLGRDNKSADDYSFGVGIVAPISITTATFDYSYTHFNDLGVVHRVSVGLTY